MQHGMRLTLLLLLACAGCPQKMAHAQISIKESKQAHWVFPNAQIVGGEVVAPVDSRPKLDRVETTIRVESVIEYKFGQLRARRLPSFERVTLDEVGKGVYKFKSSAPEGQYLLEYSAFDPEKGIASEEATVTLERANEPITPIEPDGLSALSKDARRAMQGLVAGMAADMDKAAEAVDSGKVKTVLELSAATVPWDVETRNAFKKSMATVLEPKLGKAELPAGSSKILRDIAAGFRSVK